MVTDYTLHLMCVRPCANCSLAQTFNSIENVAAVVTKTPEQALVLELKLKGTGTENRDLLPTVCEMTKQICNMCQKNR